MERRDFLKTATAATVGTALPAAAQTAQSKPPVKRPESPNMIYRELGTTGERVSAIGLGGYHIGKQPEASQSIQLIRSGIDRGITFLDNCWDYNDGICEDPHGHRPCADGYRQKVFLMTKIDGRTAAEYNKQLDESLRPPPNRHHRPRPVPRNHPPRRPRPHLRRRRRHGSRHRREEGRQNPLHRLHRPQGSGLSTCACSNAPKNTTSTSTPCRCPSTSWTRTSAASPQVMPVALKQGIGVLAMKTFGEPYILKSNTVHPIEASTTPHPPRLRRHHRHRQPRRSSIRPSKPPAPSSPSTRRRSPPCSPAPPPPPAKANSNSSKPPRTTTAPRQTPSG